LCVCRSLTSTQHCDKRLKLIHDGQSNSLSKHVTPSLAPQREQISVVPSQPKPFTPLFSPPASLQPSAAVQPMQLAAEYPPMAQSPSMSPPPLPTPPMDSLLPYQTASPSELPAPTEEVFLMVRHTHPDYNEHSFYSCVSGRVISQPADYIPTGFKHYTLFWRSGMDAPLLIPNTHTTTGVVTGHLPHVEQDWRDVHRFLARRLARTAQAGVGYLPPSSPPEYSDASTVESPDSASVANAPVSP
jgi:hypothetical protein